MIRNRIKRHARRWPGCGAWDMDELYHALRAAVLGLEDAWARGVLRDRLGDPGLLEGIGPDLYAAYLELSAQGHDAAPDRRVPVIHALLAQLRDEVFSVQRWGLIRGPVSRDGGPLDTALDGGPEVPQRVDQITARRFWGLGFVHTEDVHATDRLARDCVRRGVGRFARDVRDLARLLRRPMNGATVRVPSHADRRFEQLMLDILDEHHRRARQARLAEDFCQKTDLRVSYPGLDRQRGARVQIKSTANPELHEERVASIRNRETIVILSPVTLAEFIDGQQRACGDDRLLTPEELHAFWRCLPTEPVAIDELSYAIRSVLFEALLRRDDDPRGPMASVPEPLRLVIRTFVRDQAFRTTRALRIWEASRTTLRPAARETGGQTA